jgi:glucokinase
VIAGDESAIAAIREMADWLGIGIANLVVTLAPEVIVIGGGVSRAGDILLDPARAAATASIEGAAHRPETPIVGATLGANAGLIGAAIAAKETIDE